MKTESSESFVGGLDCPYEPGALQHHVALPEPVFNFYQI